MSLFGPTLAAIAWKIGLTSGQALFAAAGHHARALERALFAAGDAGADVEQALRFDVLRAPLGLGEMGVAAVDDHVAGLKAAG